RFRNMPTFGRDTIRRFVSNMADLKKMAARDFEDAIQCAIPVFEKILEEQADNDIVLDLLFDFGCWHATAKLRLHTDNTLNVLDIFTVSCGASVRKFARVTCKRYQTYELPRELAACGRRTSARADKGKATLVSSKKLKLFNTNTYKFHAMWDYTPSIQGFATGDNWTSQTVRRVC
ncbi:hypothetical protein C8Q79DRAFT_914017, partial [Trametes meyenii]